MGDVFKIIHLFFKTIPPVYLFLAPTVRSDVVECGGGDDEEDKRPSYQPPL